MHAVIILFKNINHSTISRCAPRTSRHGKRNTRVHLIDFPAINKPLTFWFYLMFPFPFCICCRGPRLRVLLVCRRLEALRSEGPFVIILHSNPEAARAAPAIKMISSQPAKLASNQRSTLIAVRSSSGSTLETPGFDKGCSINRSTNQSSLLSTNQPSLHAGWLAAPACCLHAACTCLLAADILAAPAGMTTSWQPRRASGSCAGPR